MEQDNRCLILERRYGNSRAVDPDPRGAGSAWTQEGKILGKKQKKCKEKWKKIVIYYKILTKWGLTPLFITLEQYFLSFSTHH